VVFLSIETKSLQKATTLNHQSPVTQQGDRNCRKPCWHTHTHTHTHTPYCHFRCAPCSVGSLSTVQQTVCGPSLAVCCCELTKHKYRHRSVTLSLLYCGTAHLVFLTFCSVRPRSHAPVFARPGNNRPGESTTWSFKTSPVLIGRSNE